MHVVFQIELKADFLLCSKFVVVFLVPLLTTMHLFVDMLLSCIVTGILMWLVSTIVTIDLMLLESTTIIIEVMWSKSAPIVATLLLNQYDLPIVPQFCVHQFIFAFLFL